MTTVKLKSMITLCHSFPFNWMCNWNKWLFLRKTLLSCVIGGNDPKSGCDVGSWNTAEICYITTRYFGGQHFTWDWIWCSNCSPISHDVAADMFSTVSNWLRWWTFYPTRVEYNALMDGRLAAWLLPGGPVGLPFRWAATSNVEVGQTTYPVNRGMVVMEGENRAKDKVTNRRRGKDGVEQERATGTLTWGESAVLGYLCRGPQVRRLLMGPVGLLSQGRSEEPVCPWTHSHSTYIVHSVIH